MVSQTGRISKGSYSREVSLFAYMKKGTSVGHEKLPQPGAGLYQCIDTLFIQIDAHALIDAHPHHHQTVGIKKLVKLMISI